MSILITALTASHIYCEWGKHQIDEALERAEQMKKTIMIPEPFKPVPLKKIMEPDCNCTKGEEQTSPVKTFESVFKKDDSEKLYLLISSSVAMSTLQAYAAQIQNSTHKNTVMVLRGFVGGIQKIRPTLDFIHEVRGGMDVPFEINPEMFEQYRITRVPAMIRQNGQDSFQITGAIDLDEANKRFEKAMAQ